MISPTCKGENVCHDNANSPGLPIINVLVVVGVIVRGLTADTVHVDESTILPFAIDVDIVTVLLGNDVGGVMMFVAENVSKVEVATGAENADWTEMYWNRVRTEQVRVE